MHKTILDIQNLSKSYGRQNALTNFTLSVQEGDIIGIAGPNGAGKTTLFRILTGLTPSYHGSISLFGSQNEQETIKNRQYIGTIIEDPAFFSEMTAQQNLAYYCIQRGVTDKSRIKELLDLVDLKNTAKKKVKDFSLGMKQRLAIALSLLHTPKLLIFDEPTNGLDPKGIVEVRQLLIKLATETNLTIMVSSHILSELENLATRFVIINHGEMIETLTKEELYNRTQSYFEIKTNAPEKAAEMIEAAYEIKALEITPTGVLKLFDADVDLAAINAMLVKAGIQVSELRRQNYQLENLFIDLTNGGHLHD